MPPTLRIRVTRDVPCPASTLSTVELDFPDDSEGFLQFAFCCEDIDRRLEEDASRKQAGSTAIPIGTYAVRLYDSPKHGPDTPELVGVHGYQHVQIHSGNGPRDTLGCLLFGLGRDVASGTVTRSKVACDWLRALIAKTIKGGGSVTIEIRRAG